MQCCKSVKSNVRLIGRKICNDEQIMFSPLHFKLGKDYVFSTFCGDGTPWISNRPMIFNRIFLSKVPNIIAPEWDQSLSSVYSRGSGGSIRTSVWDAGAPGTAFHEKCCCGEGLAHFPRKKEAVARERPLPTPSSQATAAFWR